MIDDIPSQCTQGVNLVTMQQIVRVESGGNPFAIGVVGGRLERQPQSLPEAVATVRSLEQNGFNYSIGISQVNRVHFARLGWKDAIENGFDVCANLKAGAGIFRDCFNGAVKAGYRDDDGTDASSATRASLSRYYSGNFVTGEKLGYVSRVLGTGPSAGVAGVAGVAAGVAATPVSALAAVRRKAATSMFD